MPLTPEEEKKYRDEIRKKLEDREEKHKKQKQQNDDIKRQQLEERLRAKIKEEEEEKFYADRGYVKYKNRHGETEWLKPEEAERRAGSKRSRKTSSRHRRNKTRKNLIINLSVLAGVLLIVAVVYKMNPGSKVKAGSMVIKTDIPGATIFLDGEQLDSFTPDTLEKIKTGRHFVSVYKEGYAAIPPVKAVTIANRKMAALDFALKNTAQIVRVKLNVNVKGYRLYIDGLPQEVGADGSVGVPNGYHTFMVVKKGHIASPSFRRILVQSGMKDTIGFELFPDTEMGYLQISDNLFRGNVYLDKEFTGMQARGDLLPVKTGTYEVRIKENGYIAIPDSQLINVRAGENQLVVFRLEPEDMAYDVSFKTTNPGAVVFLDGQAMPYVTPVSGLMLSPGTHYVNFMRDGEQMSHTDHKIVVNHRAALDYFYDF